MCVQVPRRLPPARGAAPQWPDHARAARAPRADAVCHLGERTFQSSCPQQERASPGCRRSGEWRGGSGTRQRASRESGETRARARTDGRSRRAEAGAAGAAAIWNSQSLQGACGAVPGRERRLQPGLGSALPHTELSMGHGRCGTASPLPSQSVGFATRGGLKTFPNSPNSGFPSLFSRERAPEGTQWQLCHRTRGDLVPFLSSFY